MERILIKVRTILKCYFKEIILILFIPIWIGIAPKWYEWYINSNIGLWMKDLYSILDKVWLINIPICLVFVFIFIMWCYKIWQDKNIRLYRPLLATTGLVILLYCKSQVKYVDIIGSFDYRMLFAILFFAILLVAILKLICYCKEKILAKKRMSEKQVGFTIDNTKENDIPESLNKYADKIVTRLQNTDIKKESYALGITGDWGSGKSTFLDVLEEKIKKDAIVVKFKPWMCRTPEQVTKDFFASLRHQLSPKYSTLSQPIKKYAKHINSLSFSPNSIISFNMSTINDESLYVQKKYLSEKFAKLSRPVVVFIDDIDRLERDEIFEVLRLIRNTADLSNMIYIVAYDKEYVTCVLEEKNIKDSYAYLEKIFNVEIHLPKADKYMIWRTLRNEIEEQSFNRNFANYLFGKFNQDDRTLILKILNNFRRVKRFTRLYMLNYTYLYYNHKIEYNPVEFFWIELLQMYDKNTYDVLANEFGRLLYINGDRLIIREGILNTPKDTEENKYEGEPLWKEESPKILNRLFRNNINPIKQSICYVENYDKFFTLTISPFRLSISEMNNIFKEGVNPENIVEKWIADGKYFNSIEYQFKQFDLCKLKDENLQTYLTGLLYYSMKIVPYKNNMELANILKSRKYEQDDTRKNKIHKVVIDWFNEKIKEDGLLPYLSKLLNILYVTSINNGNNEYESDPSVINNEEIKTLLVQVMKNYLKNHQELTAIDLLKEKGDMHYIFNNCCVIEKDDSEVTYDNYLEFNQLAFDAVINHFCEKENKPTQNEYENAYGQMFRPKTPEFKDQYEEEAYIDIMYDKYQYNMQDYFGSSYESKLEEFRTKCFTI